MTEREREVLIEGERLVAGMRELLAVAIDQRAALLNLIDQSCDAQLIKAVAAYLRNARPRLGASLH
jgi:hypothetical protein